MNITELKDRTALGPWLNENGLTGDMVEIGVAFGGYASHVLSSWKGTKYFMVDPWEEQPKEIYKEKTEGIPYDHWHKQCLSLCERDPRSCVVRLYSLDAEKLFPDDFFCCVYIDGNHCREAFLADLEAWWPKVGSGGLFGGHDCYDATIDGHYCEVASTLKGWADKKGLTYHVTPCTSWWIIKP